MNRLLPCTCACICRSATAAPSSRPFLSAVSRQSRKKATSSSTAFFATSTRAAYPRRATPFRAAASEAAPDEGTSHLADVDSPQQPWYLLEPNTTDTSPTTSDIPSFPDTLPTYLYPIWTHLYSSPFLDQKSIQVIDAQAIPPSERVEDADASVTSWTDWVVVSTLRNGRERGIRGACDGVKLAVRDSLIALREEQEEDDSLLGSEPSEAVQATSDDTPPQRPKGKKKPKVKVEGLEVSGDPQWGLVDGGRVVVHVMTASAREMYNVEGVAAQIPTGPEEMFV